MCDQRQRSPSLRDSEILLQTRPSSSRSRPSSTEEILVEGSEIGQNNLDSSKKMTFSIETVKEQGQQVTRPTQSQHRRRTILLLPEANEILAKDPNRFEHPNYIIGNGNQKNNTFLGEAPTYYEELQDISTQSSDTRKHVIGGEFSGECVDYASNFDCVKRELSSLLDEHEIIYEKYPRDIYSSFNIITCDPRKISHILAARERKANATTVRHEGETLELAESARKVNEIQQPLDLEKQPQSQKSEEKNYRLKRQNQTMSPSKLTTAISTPSILQLRFSQIGQYAEQNEKENTSGGTIKENGQSPLPKKRITSFSKELRGDQIISQESAANVNYLHCPFNEEINSPRVESSLILERSPKKNAKNILIKSSESSLIFSSKNSSNLNNLKINHHRSNRYSSHQSSSNSNRNASQLNVSKPLNVPQQELKFSSDFECGNLAYALRKSPEAGAYSSYVKNESLKKQKATFSIVNATKTGSLFNEGMKVMVHSKKQSEARGVGWHRSCTDISYTKNEYRRERSRFSHKQRFYYTLEFTYEFEEDDEVYFAYNYPYSYSDLQTYIAGIEDNTQVSKYVNRKLLCRTLAQNRVDLLTITDQNSNQTLQKQTIVLSARVHPGETVSSLMVKGFIDFLLSECEEANYLRTHFIFKIIPMLNPDGVIHGNYRCSLAGKDLNRQWKKPDSNIFAEIDSLKKLVISQKRIALFCDLHGHSMKKNIFIYGCHDYEKPSACREIPFILSKIYQPFSFKDCNFSMKPDKQGTARVALWKTLKIPNIFTLESSFCGPSYHQFHFSLAEIEAMGKALCQAFVIYFDPPPAKIQAIPNKEGIKLNEQNNISEVPGQALRKSMAINLEEVQAELQGNQELLEFGLSDTDGSDSSPSEDEIQDKHSPIKKRLSPQPKFKVVPKLNFQNQEKGCVVYPEDNKLNELAFAKFQNPQSLPVSPRPSESNMLLSPSKIKSSIKILPMRFGLKPSLPSLQDCISKSPPPIQKKKQAGLQLLNQNSSLFEESVNSIKNLESKHRPLVRIPELESTSCGQAQVFESPFFQPKKFKSTEIQNNIYLNTSLPESKPFSKIISQFGQSQENYITDLINADKVQTPIPLRSGIINMHSGTNQQDSSNISTPNSYFPSIQQKSTQVSVLSNSQKRGNKYSGISQKRYRSQTNNHLPSPINLSQFTIAEEADTLSYSLRNKDNSAQLPKNKLKQLGIEESQSYTGCGMTSRITTKYTNMGELQPKKASNYSIPSPFSASVVNYQLNSDEENIFDKSSIQTQRHYQDFDSLLHTPQKYLLNTNRKSSLGPSSGGSMNSSTVVAQALQTGLNSSTLAFVPAKSVKRTPIKLIQLSSIASPQAKVRNLIEDNAKIPSRMFL